MKRIYENVPVQTITYILSPDQKVEVRDYSHTPSPWEYNDKTKYTEKYSGLADGLIVSYNMGKVMASKLVNLFIDGDTLILGICMAYDEYTY